MLTEAKYKGAELDLDQSALRSSAAWCGAIRLAASSANSLSTIFALLIRKPRICKLLPEQDQILVVNIPLHGSGLLLSSHERVAILAAYTQANNARASSGPGPCPPQNSIFKFYQAIVRLGERACRPRSACATSTTNLRGRATICGKPSPSS